jgi:outer membrane protein TolC
VHRLSHQVRLLGRAVGLRQRAELLQHKKLRAEEAQYALGRSSSELVIHAQNDFFAAGQARLHAQDERHQTWLAYRLAIGDLP